MYGPEKDDEYGFHDGGRNTEICKLFMALKGVFLITHWVENLPEIALSLTVFKINDIFHFRHYSRWQPKFRKFKICQRF